MVGTVFIAPSEIAALPTTGKAWDAMKARAVATWGTPTISNQDSTQDTDTLAGALVAVRTSDAAMATKVRSQLAKLVAAHPYDRVLGLARQLPSYIIAADLIGITGTERTAFEAFLREALAHKMEGHSGGTDLRSTAQLSPNNWGTMSRAAVAAIAVYLNDTALLAEVVKSHQAWCGGPSDKLKYSSTTWHGPSPKAGVNRRGTSRYGHSIDGVQPEDQRRTGDYVWPAPKGSYPWEALQGAVLCGHILARAGALPFAAGDDAIVRACCWLTYENLNPASGDDKNTAWILRANGVQWPAVTPTTPAKNIAWCDWMLQ